MDRNSWFIPSLQVFVTIQIHAQISVFIFKNPYLEFQPSKLNGSKSYELLIKSNFWENWFQDFIICQKFPVFKNVNTVWLTSQKLRLVCKIHNSLYTTPKITNYISKCISSCICNFWKISCFLEFIWMIKIFVHDICLQWTLNWQFFTSWTILFLYSQKSFPNFFHFNFIDLGSITPLGFYASCPKNTKI